MLDARKARVFLPIHRDASRARNIKEAMTIAKASTAEKLSMEFHLFKSV